MKLTFVIPESARSYSFLQPPIGSLRAAAIAEKLGHRFEIVDNRVERLPASMLLRRVEASAPDLIVVTTSTFDQSQVYFLGPRLERILDTVRTLATLDTPLAVCGAHGSVNPQLLLSQIECDLLLQGEFDLTLAASLPRIQEILGTPLADRARHTPVILPQPADSPAEWEDELPAYHKVDMSRYFGDLVKRNVARRKANWGVILGSRGCPYSCDFCHLFFGRRMRYRSPASIAAEVRLLHDQYGINGFFLLDYIFTVNRSWALQVCAEIERLGLDLAWSCQTRADRLDDTILEAVRAAGCSDIWLGIESFAAETLEGAGKAITPEQMTQAVSAVRKHGIQPIGYLMLGLPGETPGTLRTTLSQLRALRLDYLDGIELATPRPGTSLFERYKTDYPRLATSWDYVEAASGLLGNDVTPGMLMSAFRWLSDRDAIYSDRPIPEFRATDLDRRHKEQILEAGKRTAPQRGARDGEETQHPSR